MANLVVKHNGQWKAKRNVYGKHNGTWKKGVVYYKANGIWKTMGRVITRPDNDNPNNFSFVVNPGDTFDWIPMIEWPPNQLNPANSHNGQFPADVRFENGKVIGDVQSGTEGVYVGKLSYEYQGLGKTVKYTITVQ